VERAAAADRRAATIAGTVAIAASFTISGGGLALDSSKVAWAADRRALAILLAFTTLSFVLSAAYALRALVAARHWRYSDLHGLDNGTGKSVHEQLGMRAAHLIDNFAYNWEVADLKNRLVSNALALLLLALLGIVAMAVVLATAI
jgi:hypothetical protein